MVGAAVMGGIALGKGIYNYVQGRRKSEMMKKNMTPKFGKTATGQYLNKVSQTGLYGGATRSRIMGRAGAQAGHVASRAAGDMLGAQRRGFGGNVTFNRGYNNLVQQKMGIMGNAAAEIDMQNEQSKQDAMMNYVMGRDRNAAARRQEKMAISGQRMAATDALAGGFFGAAGVAGNAIQGWEAGKAAAADPINKLVNAIANKKLEDMTPNEFDLVKQQVAALKKAGLSDDAQLILSRYFGGAGGR